MSLFSTPKRLAASSIVGVLAAGTLVSVGTTTAATAAEVNTTYECPVLGTPMPFPVSAVVDLPSQLVAGQPVASRAVKMGVTIPAETVGALSGLLGVTAVSGTSPDLAMLVGSKSVAVKNFVAKSTSVPPIPGPLALPATGTLSGFKAPAAGTYAVKLPEAFTFQPAGQEGAPPLPPLACTLKSGEASQVGTVKVVKAASKTRATLTNAPVNVGERAKVAVTVRASDAPAAGRVVAKEGKKVVARGTLSKRGKVTLRLVTLKRGVHDVVVRYRGSDFAKASSTKLRFRVTR